MGTRLNLHDELLTLAPQAYYQPPSSIQMTYPCFVYHLSSIHTFYANNGSYHNAKTYLLTYISRTPSDQMIDDVLAHFQGCRFDRHYVADNLHHYVFYLVY